MNPYEMLEVAPDGWGYSCRACRRHFPSLREFHDHVKFCQPAAAARPQVKRKKAEQMSFEDWREPTK
jgi:hypothetical protein